MSASARLARAGLLTAIADGLFSSVLNVALYHSTVPRLFQGVAAVVVGPRALAGGLPMAGLGLLMHFAVAFAWSAVYLFLVLRSAWVRRLLEGPPGRVAVAAVYGPLVWTLMSLAVIPGLLHRIPLITYRWWIQLLGHFPFVGVPIVFGSGRGPAAGGA